MTYIPDFKLTELNQEVWLATEVYTATKFATFYWETYHGAARGFITDSPKYSRAVRKIRAVQGIKEGLNRVKEPGI